MYHNIFSTAGYDCSVPICVQAETFLLNQESDTSSLFVELGGHGGDGLTSCLSSTSSETRPRCPQYDYRVTGNKRLKRPKHVEYKERSVEVT